MIRDVSQIKHARSDTTSIPQHDSLSSSKGIRNLECAVRLPGSNNDAMPDEAIDNTIFPIK
ncbi:hypothetical protein Tco_0667448, partial [Tanacetum coccineum]